MFELRAFDQKITCDLLSLDDNLFHTAIKGGKKRYHVNNPKGEDFDILYLQTLLLIQNKYLKNIFDY